MNIVINIDENTIENQQPKIYNLGNVITSIQDLLDSSTITITNYRIVILEFTDLDLSTKKAFLNLDDYTKGDKYGLGQNILESDLIYISSENGDSRPYKVYTALLTQVGIDAPTATVLENTLGVIPTYSYIGVGQYEINLNGGFITLKTWQVMQSEAPTSKVVYPAGNDKIGIDVVSGDNGLNDTPIEIRVYN